MEALNILQALAKRRRSLPDAAMRRALRVQAGLTQEEVAAALGVTSPTVSRWETGARSPHGKQLDAYAELLAALAREMQ